MRASKNTKKSTRFMFHNLTMLQLHKEEPKKPWSPSQACKRRGLWWGQLARPNLSAAFLLGLQPHLQTSSGTQLLRPQLSFCFDDFLRFSSLLSLRVHLQIASYRRGTQLPYVHTGEAYDNNFEWQLKRSDGVGARNYLQLLSIGFIWNLGAANLAVFASLFVLCVTMS